MPSFNLYGGNNSFSFPNDDYGWHKSVIDLNLDKNQPEVIFKKWLSKLQNNDFNYTDDENTEICINFYNKLVLWLDSLPDDMSIGIYNYSEGEFFVVNSYIVDFEFGQYFIKDHSAKYKSIYNFSNYLCIGNNEFLKSNYNKKFFNFEFSKIKKN